MHQSTKILHKTTEMKTIYIHCPNIKWKSPRVLTPLAETHTQLFELLRVEGLIKPVEGRMINPSTEFFRADQWCANLSGSAGHDTKGCINLIHKIQDLIDIKVITLEVDAPNVNLNPLSNHGGVTINLIERDKDWLNNIISGKENATYLYQQWPHWP